MKTRNRVGAGWWLAGLAAGLSAWSAPAFAINSAWNTGNGNWNVAGNWSPVDVPDNGGGSTYDVSIGNLAIAAGAQVTFVPEDDTSDTITSLVVTNSGNALVSGADLLTNGYQLVVLGQTTIDGSGSTIRVDAHATPGTAAFSTNLLDLNNGGGLTMEGGIANVNIQFEINAGSLGGHGTVNAGDGDAVVEIAFENSSLIQPSSNTAAPQTLTIHSNGVDTIDLDGTTEIGLVDVSNALANVNADTVTLIVDGPLSDAFSGTLQIGQRDTLTFNDNFTMSGADVQLNGGSQFATLNGAGDVTDIASSAFTVAGDAVIVNDMTFTGPANTVTLNANSSLTLNGAVSASDASSLVLGAGSELVITGSLTIIEAGGDIDWDGTGNNATTTIDGTGHLSLTVDQVDVGNDIFNGTINLNNGGDLTVNNTINSWQAAGVVNKNGAGTSSVNGDEFAVTNDLNVNAGTLDVNAAAIFGSTSDVIIAVGATADMATTEIHNGADITVNGTLSLGIASLIEAPASLTGSGLFRLNSTSTIADNAIVNTASFDWDGLGAGTTHTINDGVVFTINSTTWDPDDTGDVDDNINLGGNGAQIVVNNVASWTMARTLNANNAAAGTATIAGTSRFQLAGALAVLNVNGNTNISAPATFGASSTTSIDAAMTLDLGATANYEGGTIGGVGTFLPATTNSVTASSVINATNFDFDAGNWTVSNQAQLTVNVTDYDPGVATNAFDTTINLNNGDISVTTGDPSFVMDGTLNMNSTVDGQIVAWTGEPLAIGNDAGALDADLNVTGTHQSQIAPTVTFNSDADVDVAAGATLALLGTANFNTVNAANGAQFTGAGRIAFSGPVNVNEAVTLNMPGGTVDLDGLDNVGDAISIDAPMVINTGTMSNFGRVNGGGGTNTMSINNTVGTGALTVNLDDADAEWTLNGPGVIHLVNDNTEATLLAGSDVNINGTVNVIGDVRTTARLEIAGIVNINTAGQPLRLAGGDDAGNPNTIAGGTINGPGPLGADTGKDLRGFGVINSNVDFDGTADLYANGGELTVNGAILDVAVVGTLNETGILNVTGPWSTAVATTVVNQFGGEIRGGAITVANANGIRGQGLVSARVINNTRLVASNFFIGQPHATHVFQTAGNDNDWDGVANTGILEAEENKTLELRDVGAAFAFGGTVTVAAGGRVFANGFALDFNPGSSIVLNEGAYEATSSTDIGGTVTVGGGESLIKVQNNSFLTFEATSVTTLNDDLRLENNNIIIEAGATFAGGGTLIVPDGSHTAPDNLAEIGVGFQLAGSLRPAQIADVARVEFLDYQQTNTGKLYIDLTGTGLGDIDRLVVEGTADIDGFLEVDIDDGFVPELGDTFPIITAASRIGQFDFYDINNIDEMPDGLTFKVNYLLNAVQLEVVIKEFFEADFDEDGDVDPTDYKIWKNAFNLNQMGDANGDNVSNAADYTIWRNQLGSVSGGGAGSLLALEQAAVPEPGTMALLILALVSAGNLRRRAN